MYTVYVLEGENKKFYKGFTNNIERRLKEHKNGYTKTTKNMRNLKLVYKEEYHDLRTSRKRELYLKSAAGRKFLKKMIIL